ncbi:enoyl-CoA hydratase/isomerase family protein [Pueribacillus theae]|nr:enoyl-CoA hydratase/isomerase family protein [Pueribacillus theae]
MEESSIIIQEYGENGTIFVLTLNRSKQLNAINKSLLAELRYELKKISSKKNLGGLIIKSAITKAFCAGIDVAYVQSLSNVEAAAFFAELAVTFEEISHFPCPTVAAVNGYAFGAGADLALACDIRVAGRSTRFRFPGPQFGVILGTHRLVNEAGASLARKIALTNELIDADTALQYHLVHDIAEDEFILDTAVEWMKKLTRISAHTYAGICEICDSLETDADKTQLKTPIEYARYSIEQGNFNERLTQYIEELKKKK